MSAVYDSDVWETGTSCGVAVDPEESAARLLADWFGDDPTGWPAGATVAELCRWLVAFPAPDSYPRLASPADHAAIRMAMTVGVTRPATSTPQPNPRSLRPNYCTLSLNVSSMGRWAAANTNGPER